MGSGDDHRDWIAGRRLHGQLLRGPGPAEPEDVVAHLTAMQAQDHGYARWSVAQRMSGSPAAPAVDRAFSEGRILRTHVLRPTWHYVAARDLRWLIGLSGPRVQAANARRYHDLGLDARTLSRSAGLIAEAIAQGPQTRRELAAIVERHGISAEGERITYILMHAELTAVICSGPMKGKQHTYAAFGQRVPPKPGPDRDEALGELAWRYFSTRGPATLSDFSWWSGLGARDAREGLDMVQTRLASHNADGRTYWFADHSIPRTRRPQIDLVQCYDEVIISYGQTRDTLQTTHAAFPVPRHIQGFRHILLIDGRLLGHWRTHPANSTLIETRVTRPLNDTEQIALHRATESYRRFTNATEHPRPDIRNGR
jgi:hypothetical protein